VDRVVIRPSTVRLEPRRIVRRVRSGAIALAALALGACSSLYNATQFDKPPAVPDASLPSQAAAFALPDAKSDPEHGRILAAYGGLYSDVAAATAVARAVGRLVAASDDPSQTYRITILDSPVINAFALPNGNLYVTRGLLALANDTSEVAAVIAHEMAHVTARHAVARARRNEAAQVVGRVVANVVGDPEQQRMTLATTQVSLARFSQVQELEADAIGVRTLARAGYDPYAAARFLTSMQRFAEFRSNRAARSDFLSSHPTTPERITFAVRAAREIGAPGIGEQDREAYLSRLDGMVFGDNPTDGIVRGRTFTHRELGFTFSVPVGWTLENTAKAVLGADAGGSALRFDSVAVPASTPLADYLASGWLNGLDPASIETRTQGELQVATGVANADGWTFRIGIVRTGATVYRFFFATQGTVSALEPAFRETVGSFRQVSAADTQTIRPLRVALVRAQAGDTAERLASRMVGTDNKLELFLVLNGLEPGEALGVGRSFKIITDDRP
jgi:predicted Zn-dependent protease